MKGVTHMERTIKKVEFPAPKRLDVKRVAAYARVSTGKDAMLHSLSAQVSYYSDLMQRHSGWLYCGVYADEALTGTKDGRENFQRLLAACRNGEVDMVITKSISRFARNTVTLLQSIRELKELGVDVFFEEQNIYTMSADGELMLTILASYAQEESRSASENQKWRVRKGFERGELINWRFMFGYEISKNGVTINPEEAAIVRNIYRRFLEGESLSAIARHLTESGVKGTLNGSWTRTEQIRNILSNEKYTGNALLWKSFRNNHIEKKQRPNRGELPMFYAEGTHPAIIDDETFAAAQARLTEISARSEHWARPSRSAFSGLIVCGQCGQKYKRVKNHQYFAWNCSACQNHGKAACPGLQIREEVLRCAAAEALGLPEYDEAATQEQIASVVSGSDHVLTFSLKDGRIVPIEWRNPSRTESWTPEMKAEVSRRTKEQRRKQ